jgi:hypothetical protein
MIIVIKFIKNTPYRPKWDKKNKLTRVELKKNVRPKKKNGKSSDISWDLTDKNKSLAKNGIVEANGPSNMTKK